MDRHPALIHLLIFIIFLAPDTDLMAADRVTGRTFATRSEVIAPHGMVATSHPLATLTPGIPGVCLLFQLYAVQLRTPTLGISAGVKTTVSWYSALDFLLIAIHA